MPRNKQYNLRVSEKERQKFQAYVDQTTEYKSVAQMMRALAHEEIKKEERGASTMDVQQVRVVVEDVIGPLARRLEEIDGNVDRLAAQLGNLEETEDLARQLYSLLPTHDEGHAFDSSVSEADLSDSRDSLAAAQTASTVDAWAAHLGVSVESVRRAVGLMVQEYGAVRYKASTDDQGRPKRRYYKVET